MNGEPARVTPTPVEVIDAPTRERFDLDAVHDLVHALAGFLFTLAGAVGGAWFLGQQFGAWVGWLLILVVGLVVGGYSARQAGQRRADRERREEFRASQERTTPAAFDVPRLP